jgi:hypothetical protein
MLLIAALLAACQGYGPVAPPGDTVESQTIDPEANTIDDAYGTEMP